MQNRVEPVAAGTPLGRGRTGSTPRVLGQLLLGNGLISREGLDAALAEQRSTRERLGEILVRRGADPEVIARALATQLRLDYSPPPIRCEPGALALVNAKLAARLRVAPMATDERRLRVAMADPLDAEAIDDLQFQTGRRVEPLVASVRAVEAALAAYQPDEVAALVTRLRGERRGKLPAESPDVAALRRASEAAPIIALVDLVFERAVKAGASDVHIEPAGDSLRVRARIDGVMRELVVLPAHTAGAFASRIKVMADMDIAVKRKPQDGRAVVTVGDRELGLRISTLPAQRGEKTVVRILDPGNAGRSLDDLGFDEARLAGLAKLLGASHGVILVTGPTGSGKTTTLYAALARLDRKRRNLITLEDPIEYTLDGLTQVQVHRRAGLGFATALRAVLRQDPDVIMVGELRDKETVETAMAAAMTGHLVLSTVHTNDAASAATRLVDMGTPPWLIAAGLIGILAQRLVRRVCPDCAIRRQASREELLRFGVTSAPVEVREARGCHRCEDTGYRGRVGIYELIAVDGPIRDLVARGATTEAIREAARNAGSESLAEDAWIRVREGVTTLDEVAPLLRLGIGELSACPGCGRRTRPAWRNCTGCGRPLRETCTCSAAIEPGWMFCGRCGRECARVSSRNDRDGGERGGGREGGDERRGQSGVDAADAGTTGDTS
jgi:type IV pilus assembly protein PilB